MKTNAIATWRVTCSRIKLSRSWITGVAKSSEVSRTSVAAAKNQADGVHSTQYVPLRGIIAFIVVMNKTIKPYLSAKGHTEEDVENMHRAWTESLQLQVALWAQPYANSEW